MMMFVCFFHKKGTECRWFAIKSWKPLMEFMRHPFHILPLFYLTIRSSTETVRHERDLKWKVVRVKTESVATLPPFGTIEGQKWFDQISSQWESQKNRFALIYFGKIQFLPPCIWNLPFMSYSLWILPKEINANWFFWDSHWLEIWVRSHAPSIRSYRGTKVVWPDIQPMRVPEEPVCIDLFR